ncbi:hypothetical protein COCMIDRAFT_22890 [Bipolaris oryzae ATCC 44560]|uniref:Uncharacterized protein n=1 Tax=Bipolaris oryzae ATCC 44560 TaxID=930090 RepID=W6ZCI7_COCMI|nr:uncharacterized protein COCMIDRAFT_22890 [Bipolaris oryzae ATCC 44560]EUC49522.1 hypothetical protein COCMIDRAFT_22890 [Bipolaris oryzae ATCC 44560]
MGAKPTAPAGFPARIRRNACHSAVPATRHPVCLAAQLPYTNTLQSTCTTYTHACSICPSQALLHLLGFLSPSAKTIKLCHLPKATWLASALLLSGGPAPSVTRPSGPDYFP